MTSAGEIRVSQDGNVATVVIDNAKKLNAVSLAMYKTIRTIFDDLSASASVRCIVLAGAGGNFSAGGDISEFADNRFSAEQAAEYDTHSDAAVQAISGCPKPVIAAIDGYAIGGGYLLALACDLRVAGAGAKIGMPPAKLGLVYGAVDMGLVMRVLRPSVAKLMLLSARKLNARQAHDLGMVDMLSEADAMSEALTLAKEIAGNYPDAVQAAKRLVDLFCRPAIAPEAALAAEASALAQASAESPDHRVAVERFTKPAG